MRIGSAFPSKYIKAADLPDGKIIKVTIDHVTVEDVAGNDNPDEQKPVLYFAGKDKGMVLNKTNATTISQAYGDETDEWAGRQIGLFSTETTFQGKMVPTIRVKIDNNMRAAPAAERNHGRKGRAAVTAPVDEDAEAAAGIDDKDIPF